jgi:hypothetical protein
MVIFHSYVSLPEGISQIIHVHDGYLPSDVFALSRPPRASPLWALMATVHLEQTIRGWPLPVSTATLLVLLQSFIPAIQLIHPMIPFSQPFLGLRTRQGQEDQTV